MLKNLNERENIFILENNYIGHLGYIYKNSPFVIPITYYYDHSINAIICYSSQGHKITAMRKNNSVSLSVSDIVAVNNWKSVLIHGTYEELSGSEAKSYLHGFSLGIKEVITEKEQRKLNFISDFSSKIYTDDVPVVFLIRIESMTGKLRKT